MNRKQKAKLALKRETLRKIDETHLAQVAGGTYTFLTQTISLQPTAITICTCVARVGTTVSVNTACGGG